MSPANPRPLAMASDLVDEVPSIDATEPFASIVDKLLSYISKAVDAAYTYEQLRTSFAGQSLRPLIASLSNDCHHPALVAAILASRYQFKSLENDGSGINDSRALACEFVAWQFLIFLCDKELMDYLLYELPQRQVPPPGSVQGPAHSARSANGHAWSTPSTADDETAPLLQSRPTEYDSLVGPDHEGTGEAGATGTSHLQGRSKSRTVELSDDLAGMNALEIALVCDAKKFISSHPVQKVVTDVWNGDIMFWESLSVHAQKKPVVYKKRAADPFIRLRVPKYQKAFQVIFFLLVSVIVVVPPGVGNFTQQRSACDERPKSVTLSQAANSRSPVEGRWSATMCCLACFDNTCSRRLRPALCGRVFSGFCRPRVVPICQKTITD